MSGPAGVEQSDGSAGKRALQAPRRAINGAKNRSRPGSYPQVKQAAFQKILTFAPVQNMAYVGGNCPMMTPKQKRFCQEYLCDLNATQASIRAGYSEKTANAQGPRLLLDVGIQAAIQEGQKRIAHNLGVTAERIVAEYAKLAFSDMADYVAWNDDNITLEDNANLTQAQTAAVQEISRTETKDGGTTKIKLHDKIRALDSLARHLGMFVDKHDVTVRDGLSDRMRRAEERVATE